MHAGLDERQLDELRQRLLEQEARLQRELGEDLDMLAAQRDGRFAGGARDSGDESNREQDRDLGGAILAHHRADLSALRAALARMEDGSYGECIVCGGAIGYERLSAQPGAARCLACQTDAERDH